MLRTKAERQFIAAIGAAIAFFSLITLLVRHSYSHDNRPGDWVYHRSYWWLWTHMGFIALIVVASIAALIGTIILFAKWINNGSDKSRSEIKKDVRKALR